MTYLLMLGGFATAIALLAYLSRHRHLLALGRYCKLVFGSIPEAYRALDQLAARQRADELIDEACRDAGIGVLLRPIGPNEFNVAGRQVRWERMSEDTNGDVA